MEQSSGGVPNVGIVHLSDIHISDLAGFLANKQQFLFPH
jgi:hypothetical protein